MKVILVIFSVCFVDSRALNLAASSGAILEWLENSEGPVEAVSVQALVDVLVKALIETNNTQTVYQLLNVLGEDSVERRADDQVQQPINNGKLGHCCLGGKLTATYHDKEITVPIYHSTHTDTHTDSRSCGFGGWSRCPIRTVTSNQRVYYTSKKIVVKVPAWTCGVENAVCCHGYVTITKIPGGLAEIGANNCIEARKALFTIIQLQLLEKITQTSYSVAPEQMNKILEAVNTFFNSNGISAEGAR